MKNVLLAVTALILVGAVSKASADIVEVNVTGTLGQDPIGGIQTYDSAGIFGTPGSLLGQSFSVVWIIDTTCGGNCFIGTYDVAQGGSFVGATNSPVLVGVLTINHHSVTYGPGIYTYIFGLPIGSLNRIDINDTATLGPMAMNTFVYTPSLLPDSVTTPFSYNFNSLTDNLGFPVQLGGGFSWPGANGYFMISNISLQNLTNPDLPPFNPAPGPVAGAGLPGLIFAAGGLLGWWRRKRKAEAAA